jgi:type I restriction enzyme S subunit
MEIALPPMAEQKRIAARLREQMAEVERARAAVQAQLDAAQILPTALLRSVFEGGKWKWIRVDELADTCSGTTPSRGRQDFYGGKIPWVKTGELVDGIIHDTGEHITETALRETSLRLLPKNTLLIAMYGQGQTRGRTALLACEATTNQACFAILPNENFDPKFLQLWFQFSYARLRQVSEGRGGNQSNFNGKVLGVEQVPLPPVSEQRAIVARLGIELTAARSLVETLETRLAEIELLPATLLRRTFNGDQ